MALSQNYDRTLEVFAFILIFAALKRWLAYKLKEYMNVLVLN